jgi:hypothetical protein
MKKKPCRKTESSNNEVYSNSAGYYKTRIRTKYIKVKVKVMSLCLTKHHAMKTYRRSGGVAPCILDLSTRWEWSDSRPVHFTPKERAPVTYGLGGWVGPSSILDAVVKRKIPSLYRESNPRTSIVQPVA